MSSKQSVQEPIDAASMLTQEQLSYMAATIADKMLLAHKEILTLDEAAQYTGMTPSALYKLTSTRKIPFSKPNGKNCFFRRTELEDWLMSNPVATTTDLNTRAQAYCMK